MRFSITAILGLSAIAFAQVAPNAAGSKNVGAGNGAQFITGGCVSNADCSSACCAKVASSGAGVCSAEAAALQNGKTGCGFTDPNAAAVIQKAKAQVAKQGFRRVVRAAADDEEEDDDAEEADDAEEDDE